MRKRRAYYNEVKNLTQQTSTGPGGVSIEHSGFSPEENATIIE